MDNAQSFKKLSAIKQFFRHSFGSASGPLRTCFGIDSGFLRTCFGVSSGLLREFAKRSRSGLEGSPKETRINPESIPRDSRRTLETLSKQLRTIELFSFNSPLNINQLIGVALKKGGAHINSFANFVMAGLQGSLHCWSWVAILMKTLL